jgi:MFS superfamily sulfate permease-like transporter
MISEVVRSTSNIGFGGRTKWANFFHGIFLLLAMLLIIPFIELIPNAALAAMLIFAGFRLAAPSQFIHTWHIGKEQLAIFLTTIVITLAEDLLLGIAAGILVKFAFHLYNGAPLKSLFKAHYTVEQSEATTVVRAREAAIFSNLIGFKKLLDTLPGQATVAFDLSQTRLVDHSFMAFITHFANRYNEEGGQFTITGLGRHRPLSAHPLATQKLAA